MQTPFGLPFCISNFYNCISFVWHHGCNFLCFLINWEAKEGLKMIQVCDINEMKPLLAKYGFHFSKAKGQNFLIKPWVPAQIAEQSGIDGDSAVLEVGPGIGSLTQQLCLRAKKVVAVELDTSLKPILAETMAGFDNLTLLFDNVLKTDLSALVRSQFGTLRPMACANLPYYITSPILTLLLESRLFSSVTVMVQKEVAQRICAKAGSADYSAFSVFCNYYAEPELLFDVSPDCFLPQPKVTSSVITLKTRQSPVCEIAEETLFFRVVRASFLMRRKTLVNGLAAGFPQFSKAELAKIITQCGFSENIRGETLDIPGFAAIANEMSQRRNV